LEQEKEAQFFATSEQNSSLFEKEQQLQEVCFHSRLFSSADLLRSLVFLQREDRLALQIASFKSLEQSQSVQLDSTFESKLQDKLQEMRIELESDFDKEVAEQLQEIVKEKLSLEKQKSELVDRSNKVEQSMQDLKLQQSKLESEAQKLHIEQGELHSMFKELETVRQELAHERSQLDELRVNLQRSELEPSINLDDEHLKSEHEQDSNSEDAGSFANDEELLEVAQAMESLKSELSESQSRIQQLESQRSLIFCFS
jgi:chromosome segregation ATPase